ncbi:TyeA [compost metagenome]
MQELVSISGNQWVDGRSIENLADKRNIAQVRSKITFISDVRNIFKALPIHVYPNIDTRNAVIQANQAALDTVIALEDEE